MVHDRSLVLRAVHAPFTRRRDCIWFGFGLGLGIHLMFRQFISTLSCITINGSYLVYILGVLMEFLRSNYINQISSFQGILSTCVFLIRLRIGREAKSKLYVRTSLQSNYTICVQGNSKDTATPAIYRTARGYPLDPTPLPLTPG
jgi:hypothetical protein